MSLKAFVLMAPLALGGLWATGALGSSVYSRDVDRSPAQVMEAIADLDVREQPGSPGTDPSASGGVTPLFRSERTDNSITFFVMSGQQVATKMTAFLEPLDGGARTRVTATVERGDAPDDFVSPAFRSEGITLGLFRLALEGELNELTLPQQRKSVAECEEMMATMLMASAPALVSRPENLTQGVGNGAQMVVRLHAIEAELRRQGCDTNQIADGGFAELESAIMEGDPNAVRFEPGKPMVNVSRREGR
jgi:hypothetical protein